MIQSTVLLVSGSVTSFSGSSSVFDGLSSGLLPVVPLQLGMKILYHVLNAVVTGLVNFTLSLLMPFIGSWLFFPNPVNIPALNELWWTSFFTAFPILGIECLVLFGLIQLFPESSQLDPWRIPARVLLAFIVIALSQPLLGLAVEATHTLGQFYYPGGYSLDVIQNSTQNYAAGVAGNVLAFLGGLVLLYSVGLGTLASLLLLLGIRAFAVYAIYGLFPILMALWVGDVGPVKYGYMIANSVFQLFVFLLVFGILISAVLATGNAIASYKGDPASTSGTTGGQTPTGVQSYNPVTLVFMKVMALFGSFILSAGFLLSSFGVLLNVDTA